MNNFTFQNKLDSVSALWSKKMALEILCNAFKKGYNNWVSTFLKHFFEWLNVVTETVCDVYRITTIAAARRLQLICIQELKSIFISLKKGQSDD